MKHYKGIIAITPLFVLALSFLALSAALGDFSKVPLLIVFILTAVYALCITRELPLKDRLKCFSKGAGAPDLLMMVWIFMLAGAFAASAKTAGCIDATVNATLSVLPDEMILSGIFIAACFVSLSIGTSVGTIVALVPVAVGVAAKTDISVPMATASAVGGAFFGDNLSFISDTTIVATQSQGCKLNDKFRVNFRIVLPAAIITMAIYVVLGLGQTGSPELGEVNWLKMLPYIVVIGLALTGMNVLLVLLIGNLFTGIIGISTGAFDIEGWFAAIQTGIRGMAELIMISMLAGGLLALIKQNGGIDYIIRSLTKRVSTGRGAEWSIAALVSITNLCTANNTVAILSVGKLSRDIAEKYGVDKRKSASVLDTFSCFVQSLIPYGAQLLMAAGLAAISPVEIIPFLFYPFIMGACAMLAIQFRYPGKYSSI